MRKETLLVISSLLFTLGIGEVALGLFFPQRTVNQYLQDRPAMFLANETLFMDLNPGFTGYLKEEEFKTDVSINSLGYRQHEFRLDKSAQTRVLVVGDSFTFGYGVEEADGYVRVLERELVAANASLNIEVINAGVPAWWTDAYYLYLKTRGLALDPDVVVLGLFMGNDVDARDARHAIWPETDAAGLPLAITSDRVRIDNGHRVRVKRRARWVIPVLRNSHLFQLLYTSGKNIGRQFSPKIQAKTLYQETYSAETEAIIVKVKKLIVAMATMTQAQNARFIVAMIPERTQVYNDRGKGRQSLDYAKPQRLLAKFFTQEHIEYVDLLPAALAAAASDEPLYYTKDSHFTRAGYLVAGRELARGIIAKGVFATPTAR